jgi:hypothetical protein
MIKLQTGSSIVPRARSSSCLYGYLLDPDLFLGAEFAKAYGDQRRVAG